MKIQLPVVQKAKQWKRRNKKALGKLRGLANLDNEILSTHERVFSEVDCLECANCCKTTGPLFTQKDIQRISKHLGIKAGRFIQKYLLMDEDGDFILQVLPCPFLAENNACNIYNSRPKACREYPHTYQKGQSKIFSLTMKNMEICPAVFEIFKRVVK